MRFGLFGTGWWARGAQGPGLVAAPDVDLVGVWGRDVDKAAALAADLGTRAYADQQALIDDVEAVAVALPPDVQAPLAVRAARAGRHLLLDKPLALSVADADRVVDAVEEAGCACAVFFTGRYQPAVERALQDAVRRGGWDGGRASVFVSVLRPGGVLRDSTWRVEHGALWDAAPHAVSALVPVLGAVREVTGVEGARRTTHLLLRHETGAVSSLATTLEAPEAAAVWDVELHGEPGWTTLPGWTLPASAAFGEAVADLCRAAAHSEPADAGAATRVGTRCDAGFARDVVAVLEAGATAVAQGRTVRVADRSRRP